MSVATEIMEYEGDPDYGVIRNTILSSEPLHAEDVESHIKFAKVWGGGKGQHLTKDVCTYIKLHQETFKVTANHFDQLATVRVNPALDLPARFVSAIVKTIATRQGQKGLIISSKTIKGVLEKKADKIQLANTFMRRASDLCPVGFEFERGMMECDMVEHVFETTPEFKNANLEKMVETFLASVSNTETNPIDATPMSTADTSTVFDATVTDASTALLRREGLKEGAVIEPRRTNKRALETQYVVNHLNPDGSIGVRKILLDDSLEERCRTVKPQEIKEYAIVKDLKKKRLKVVVVTPFDFRDISYTYKMVAEIALWTLYKQYQTKNVMIQLKPQNRLLATKDLAAGELVLIPWTQNVANRVIEATKKDAGHVYVEVLTDDRKIFKISAPPGDGKEHVAPFWKMQDEVHDKKSANCEFVKMTQKVKWPMDVGLGMHVDVEVKSVKNFKAIAANHEVRVWKPPTLKEKKPMLLPIG